MSKFEKATKSPRRLKMYVYGETGTGKTVTALQFPNPAVIDTERGTLHYGKVFDFDTLYTSSFKEINEAVNELLEDSGKYKTLVIDPFSNVWDRMIEDLQTYLRKKKGNPKYEITGLDYRPLKSQVKSFINKLNSLDLNIVLTARSKDVYTNDSSEFMKKIGTEPEGPKYLPNMFDVVMEITKDKDSDIRTAHVDKDRTNTLPRTFEFTYEKLTKYFGIEDLERDSVSFSSEFHNLSGRHTKIMHKGSEKMSAGVQAKQLEIIEKYY